MAWVCAIAGLFTAGLLLAARLFRPFWLDWQVSRLLEAGREMAAVAWLESAVEAWTDRCGELSLRVAARRAELARLYYRLGRPEAASRLLDGAAAVMRDLDIPPTRRLVESLRSLALAQQTAGLKMEAVETWERLRDVAERLFGPRHPEVAETMGQLGALLSLLGDHDRAHEYLDRSLDMCQAQYGFDSAETACALIALAEALMRESRWPEALAGAERAETILRARRSAEHPRSLETIARIYEGRGRLGDAERYRARACHLMEEIAGASHPSLAEWIETRAILLRKLERHTEAAMLERRASVIWDSCRHAAPLRSQEALR